MFLRNFWEIVRLNAFGGKDYNKTSWINYPTSIKNLTGTAIGYLYVDSYHNGNVPNFYPNSPDNAGSTNNMYGTHLFYAFTGLVGSGSTEVTPDDYKLDNDKTNQFTNTSTTMDYAVNNDGHFVITITWTGFNNSNTDIVVTEFGAKRNVSYRNSAGDPSAKWAEALMMRYVLTTPVTIPAKTNGNIIVSCELY